MENRRRRGSALAVLGMSVLGGRGSLAAGLDVVSPSQGLTVVADR